RLTHFLESQPGWGAALDFTHYKIYARTDRSVTTAGVWQGTPVGATALMSQYVQRFEISHGVNVLSVNGLHRWSIAGDRFQPYVGAGLGYYVPHAESMVGDRWHETGYQGSGVGYQLFAGLHVRLSQQVGA